MPSKENIVKRLNFCMWIEQSVRWMPMDKWDACAAQALKSLPDLNHGEVVAGQLGYDLAGVPRIEVDFTDVTEPFSDRTPRPELRDDQSCTVLRLRVWNS
jgi:hypothetical protein